MYPIEGENDVFPAFYSKDITSRIGILKHESIERWWETVGREYIEKEHHAPAPDICIIFLTIKENKDGRGANDGRQPAVET